MATTVMFDTLKFVEILRASGFDDLQAKGIVSIIREAQDTHLDELANKRDLKELEVKMETRFKEVDAKLKELELRMVIKLGAMILASVGLVVTANRFWPIPVSYVSPPAQEMRLPTPLAPTLPR